MRLLLDINVVMDFLARRPPNADAAMALIDAVAQRRAAGVLAAHAIPTLYYLVAKSSNRETAMEAVRWLLSVCEVADCGKSTMLDAVALPMPDFEDAVTAIAARDSGCQWIVTSNLRDFAGSPVPCTSPSEMLALLGERG